jgi:hypothetical protein
MNLISVGCPGESSRQSIEFIVYNNSYVNSPGATTEPDARRPLLIIGRYFVD